MDLVARDRRCLSHPAVRLSRAVALVTCLFLVSTSPAIAQDSAGECLPVAPSGGNVVVSNTQSWAQVFTANATGSLRSVQLTLSASDGIPSQPLQVEFAQHAPPTTFMPLTATTVSGGSISTNPNSPTTVVLTFPSSPMVVMGQQYGIVLTTDESTRPYRAHLADTSDLLPVEQGCPEDQLKVSIGGAPYIDQPDDLAFRVLVDPAGSGGDDDDKDEDDGGDDDEDEDDGGDDDDGDNGDEEEDDD
jgi:hypothetical protein